MSKASDLTKLTPAERKALILRSNKNQHTPAPTFADQVKNAAIAGRGVHLARNL